LLERAKLLLVQDDPSAVQELLHRAITADGNSSDRLAALRMFIVTQPISYLDEIEPLLVCLPIDDRKLGQAWIAIRKGDYSEAERQLQTAVLPRHHTSPRWSMAHETLGDAYAGLGRLADAQAQWRLALATDYDPGGTGYDQEALQKKLDQSVSENAQPYLPLIRYHDALSILDVRSVERTPEGVSYSKLVLLKEDEKNTAYGIDSYEMDCDQPRRRVVAVRAFDVNGNTTREAGSTPWLDDRYDDPFLSTERRLLCSLDLEMEEPVPAKSPEEMVQAYRAGEPVFD
jgi:tetratricopeptide (TPR) repeat protein